MAGNSINTVPGSNDNFPEKVRDHEDLSKLNPYWASRDLEILNLQGTAKPMGPLPTHKINIEFKIGQNRSSRKRPKC